MGYPQSSICYLPLLWLLFPLISFGQEANITIPEQIRLPHDTVESRLLFRSLSAFLEAIKTNTTDSYVQPSELAETAVLLDEMKDVSGSGKADSVSVPQLINCIRQGDTAYLIQLAYMEDSKHLPVAIITLIAEKANKGFHFHSPLRQNTAHWKHQKFGSTNLYFKQSINATAVKAYFDTISSYDRRLKVTSQQMDLYCADNFHEALQLSGVDYKMAYNGYSRNTLTAVTNNRKVSVNGVLTSGFNSFDPHDLWHERLHNVLSTSVINRPVDEGTAYLYGGSWGLSWQEILKRFKAFARANPGTDWIALYNESRNFDPTAKYPLNVDFAINALIVRKMEREQGMKGVMGLLSCGKKEAGNANYFLALERLAGVSKEQFNAYVEALLKGF